MTPPAPDIPIRVLVVDGIDPLSLALVHALRAEGHPVITHARHITDQADVHAQDVSQALESIEHRHGPFNRIVFACPTVCDTLDTPADIQGLAHDLARTLAELQAVVRMLCRQEQPQGPGQVWVIVPEDGMRHYLDVPSQPVRSRALMAAVKSIAKEVHGLGVRMNVLQVQALSEQMPAQAWSLARPWLKAYALKFKPQRGEQVARFLQAFLLQSDLPLSGMVAPVGVGFPENNV